MRTILARYGLERLEARRSQSNDGVALQAKRTCGHCFYVVVDDDTLGLKALDFVDYLDVVFHGKCTECT